MVFHYPLIFFKYLKKRKEKEKEKKKYRYMMKIIYFLEPHIYQNYLSIITGPIITQHIHIEE